MITVELDDRVAIERLTAMPDRVRQELNKRVHALAVQLSDRVRRKLSGEVLNVVSGALRASIDMDVQSETTSVTATVFSSGDVKYAAIHEYGGVIPAHEILPNKAQALMFEIGGETVFAKRVQMPDVTMPERSYLRSSLAEMRDQIVEEMREAVVAGMQ
jgi:phage gpG-like protein